MQLSVRWGSLWAAAAMLIAASGCAVLVNKPDGTVTTSTLASEKKALALLLIARQGCSAVSVNLAVPDGDGYRFDRVVVPPITGQSNVSEIELDPGDYHVVHHLRTASQGLPRTTMKNLGSTGGIGVYRQSYASFRVAAGEIVNLGELLVLPTVVPGFVDVKVQDWPAREVDLFRKERPTLYAQMKTRLLTVKPPAPTAEQLLTICDKMRTLHADGKLQKLPPPCTAGWVP
jgi:hypothetical protein